MVLYCVLQDLKKYTVRTCLDQVDILSLRKVIIKKLLARPLRGLKVAFVEDTLFR